MVSQMARSSAVCELGSLGGRVILMQDGGGVQWRFVMRRAGAV